MGKTFGYVWPGLTAVSDTGDAKTFSEEFKLCQETTRAALSPLGD